MAGVYFVLSVITDLLITYFCKLATDWGDIWKSLLLAGNIHRLSDTPSDRFLLVFVHNGRKLHRQYS